MVANRYFYDNLAHYDLDTPRRAPLRGLLARLMPRPDVAILLLASPETIAARRSNYSREYVDAVEDAYRRLPDWFPQLIVDRVGRRPAHAERAEAALRERLEAMSDRSRSLVPHTSGCSESWLLRVNGVSAYSPDVDGMRALAVMAVILFHLRETLLPGGFVGVDIFFTVSGFLITRNICAELDGDRFSLLEFYRRRVKRIAPAMLVVVLATLIGTQWLMLPEDARAAAKSAFWSLASAANVYFWTSQDTSYFATDSKQLPLLHLWSLGIEEQFYVLWPVLLLIFYKARRSSLIVLAMIGAAVASFGLAQVMSVRSPGFAYYMLPCRAGELLMGAVLAIASLRGVHRKFPAASAAPIAVTGLLLIGLALVLLSGNSRFPGWWAVPPTLGTACLIWAGLCGTNAVSRALAWSPFVWIGKVSYSAYLWHWPLVALYRYGHSEIGVVPALVIFTLTFLLSWGTFRCVEQPARRSSASAFRVITGQYVLPAGTLAIVTLCLIYPGRVGLSLSSPAYAAQLSAIRKHSSPAFMSERVCQSQMVTAEEMTNPKCVNGADGVGEPGVILWGDSNAAHYVGMLDVFGRSAGFRFRNVEIGSCPPDRWRSRPLRGDETRDRLPRVARTDPAGDRSLLRGHHLVVMAGLRATLRHVPAGLRGDREAAGGGREARDSPGQDPGGAGYDRRCREKQLSYPGLSCADIVTAPSREIVAANDRLRSFAASVPGVDYFEATSYVCPGGVCSTTGMDGLPRYFDQSHLTMEASFKLGRQVVASEGVPRPFATIAAAASKSARQSRR